MDKEKRGFKEVQDEIVLINTGKSEGNELVFDPKTGELVVTNNPKKVNPDATTITQIAEDGFAGNN